MPERFTSLPPAELCPYDVGRQVSIEPHTSAHRPMKGFDHAPIVSRDPTCLRYRWMQLTGGVGLWHRRRARLRCWLWQNCTTLAVALRIHRSRLGGSASCPERQAAQIGPTAAVGVRPHPPSSDTSRTRRETQATTGLWCDLSLSPGRCTSFNRRGESAPMG
jgi:hypothetical protein